MSTQPYPPITPHERIEWRKSAQEVIDRWKAGFPLTEKVSALQDAVRVVMLCDTLAENQRRLAASELIVMTLATSEPVYQVSMHQEDWWLCALCSDGVPQRTSMVLHASTCPYALALTEMHIARSTGEETQHDHATRPVE